MGNKTHEVKLTIDNVATVEQVKYKKIFQLSTNEYTKN